MTLLEQSKAAHDPIKLELINLAAQHLEALISRSNIGSSINGLVDKPKKRPNLLALSGATTSLRALLRDLGVSGEPVDPDAPPPMSAPLEVRQAWSRRYVERVIAETAVSHELESK